MPCSIFFFFFFYFFFFFFCCGFFFFFFFFFFLNYFYFFFFFFFFFFFYFLFFLFFFFFFFFFLNLFFFYYFGRFNTKREVAQLGRALGLGPRGRRFESCLPDYFEFYYGALAQLGERLLCTQEVSGSIPLGSTKLFLKMC